MNAKTIEMEMSDEQQLELIDWFVRNRLSENDAIIFATTLDAAGQGTSHVAAVKTALYAAVINATINVAVEAAVTSKQTSSLPDEATLPPVTTEVFCRLQVEGTHSWPACDVEGVDFLRHVHRHIFHVEARVVVDHPDRDREFIDLKRELTQHFREMEDIYGCVNFGAKSCEMIGAELIHLFDLSSVTVSEDGENGATVWA